MPYQFFHTLCPAIAEVETRTITVHGDESARGLPPGHYTFYEMFCNERGCDCRRVFFYVVSSFREGPEAVVAWGWEAPEFYAKWLHGDDPEIITELIGPTLNLGSPATELADRMLDFVRDVLLQDPSYVERVKCHYQQFRQRIDFRTATTTPRRKFRKKKKKRR